MTTNLTTENLVLRKFEKTKEEATRVQLLAGDKRVSENTSNIPHPYPYEAAIVWISKNLDKWEQKTGFTWAITLKEDPCQVIGAISLGGVDLVHSRAELGYWLGVDYWGRGIMTEAGNAVLAYSFEEIGLNKVWSQHYAKNPASGRVMQKLGMQLEGTMRQHIQKNGVFHDLIIYSILKPEFEK